MHGLTQRGKSKQGDLTEGEDSSDSEERPRRIGMGSSQSRASQLHRERGLVTAQPTRHSREGDCVERGCGSDG